ncbi:MAG: hypothetical protein Q8P56_01490 [Candidatus Uhrbacteria bacterium]|nr:hypothetical protein [Candidatus Uhrbacteria bacterium]
MEMYDKSPFADDEVGCDTGIETEDTADTTIEDTGSDTAEVPACDFAVNTMDGEIVMGNTLSIELPQQFPTGPYADELDEVPVLGLGFTAEDARCESLTVQSMILFAVFTDMADTDWEPTVLWATNATGEYIGSAFLDVSGVVYAVFSSDFTLEPGVTQGIYFYADLEGASREMDDQVKFDLYPTSVRIEDERGNSHIIVHDGYTNGTVSF